MVKDKKNAFSDNSSGSVSKKILPLEAKSFIPHRPPMLFVERLLEREGDRAVAETTLPTTGIVISNGRLLPEYFIELIAQTAALANGYDLFCEDKAPTDGMLVGIDAFSVVGAARAGHVVHIKTNKTFTFGPVNVIHGSVWDGELQLAYGEIKVWENVEK
jgi:hypothetical protein